MLFILGGVLDPENFNGGLHDECLNCRRSTVKVIVLALWVLSAALCVR